MQVNDLLRQRKADAGFSAFAHVKAVEDVRQVRFGDAVSVVLYKSFFLSFCRIVVVGFQIGCVQFVHIERLVRLHNGRSAFHVPFYVKDVSRGLTVSPRPSSAVW